MTPRPDAAEARRPVPPDDDQDGGQDRRGPSPAEKVTLAVGVAIILGLVGSVTYLYVAGGDRPPRIEAAPLLAEIRREQETYYLPIAISNRGDRTAVDVLVLVTLNPDGGSPEAAELTVEFLAGGETIEGTAVFSTDPEAGQLVVDVASFR